jgi:recombination protein RecA
VRRIEAIKDGTNIIGNRTRVKVVKNKVAPPFKEAQFDILYNEGISRLGDLIDVAVEQNIINKAGSWFSYKEERIGQGRDAVKKFLTENPVLAKTIDQETRKKLGMVAGPQGTGTKPPVAPMAPPPVAPAAPPPAEPKTAATPPVAPKAPPPAAAPQTAAKPEPAKKK